MFWRINKWKEAMQFSHCISMICILLFMFFVSGNQPVCCELSISKYSNEARVTGNLTEAEFKELRKTRIGYVIAENDADLRLFELPKMHHKFQTAILESKNNSSLLASLARNYPDIAGLRISQEGELKDSDVLCLASFCNLTTLSLDCPIADPTHLIEILRKKYLDLLVLSNSSLVSIAPKSRMEFPNLRRLSLFREQISTKFFTSIFAPKLYELTLRDCPVSFEILKAATVLPGLTSVNLIYYPKQDSDEVRKRLKIEELEKLNPNIRFVVSY